MTGDRLPVDSNFSDAEILALRGPKAAVDVGRPYAYLVEPECGADGQVADVATLFLTNRECPFRCLMCDLWRHTTDSRVPLGAIPAQIEFALTQLPPARRIKLYNSGNFFDHQAIPPEDYPRIAELVRSFETVIVENHPRLCGDDCLRFRDLLSGELEIALGLETVHPDILPRLNKRMTLDDFGRATEFLKRAGIRLRAFLLLKPPFMTELEGLDWTKKSIDFAQDCGVDVCVVIPTRGGNGMLEQLAAGGQFSPPSLESLAACLEYGLQRRRGRVFVDLWDAERFAGDDPVARQRVERLRTMNLTQHLVE